MFSKAVQRPHARSCGSRGDQANLLGIEMTFRREGRGGARTIKLISSAFETGPPRVSSGGTDDTVSTVSTV
jgi:hypothetical protein